MTPSEVVTAFFEANQRMDLEEVLAFMTEDVVFDTIAMPAGILHGKAAVRDSFKNYFAGVTAIEEHTVRQFGSGNLVCNERLHRIEMGGKWMDLRTASIFELRDGKIAMWNDYWDLAASMAQLEGF